MDLLAASRSRKVQCHHVRMMIQCTLQIVSSIQFRNKLTLHSTELDSPVHGQMKEQRNTVSHNRDDSAAFLVLRVCTVGVAVQQVVVHLSAVVWI